MMIFIAKYYILNPSAVLQSIDSTFHLCYNLTVELFKKDYIYDKQL